MSKPNVYFCGSAYGGCNYVRNWLPAQANGWGTIYRGLDPKTRKEAKVVRYEMEKADIIVFHRADTNWHHRVAMELKKMGKKIVYDNDDTFCLDESHAFFNLDEKGFAVNRERINNVTNNFIINADLVTASTEQLAKEYSVLNPNTHILKNYVDPSDWETPLRNEGDKVRIGLVGSTAYMQDFEVIKDLIAKLGNRDDIQLVLFGLWSNKKRHDNPLVEKVYKKEYAFWDQIKNKEHVEWTEMSGYFHALNKLKLDIMLIPRADNYFNTCKSNIKFLEAAMCEVPVIASSFDKAPYEELDGEIGIKVKNNEFDWACAIDLLVKEKDLRQEMGKKAKEYVLKNYDIKDHAEEWVDVYNKLQQ
jgi:glycosyltransferase involved in cell wall biosynthesis